MGKYFEKLQPYMKLIQDLRFDGFVKYAKEKSMTNHKLTCQGYEIPDVDDFVIIKDEKKCNYIRYCIIMALSDNLTKALVKTKR